jgi:hypothetical protein
MCRKALVFRIECNVCVLRLLRSDWWRQNSTDDNFTNDYGLTWSLCGCRSLYDEALFGYFENSIWCGVEGE